METVIELDRLNFSRQVCNEPFRRCSKFH